MRKSNMKERYKCLVAVFLVLMRNNEGKTEILLQKRQNTGYMDGMYDVCTSGHVEQGESLKHAMVRETKEEIGIDIDESDLELVNVYHENQSELSLEYLKFFFRANNYIGIPKIMEPYKNAELLWIDVNNLPENTIYAIKEAINKIISNINYFDRGF